MRIIAGKYKGRRLTSFQAANVRPTTDRVKETLFNILQSEIAESRVLDLFSGTGNLAIECLSRGAMSVDLVENHRASLKIIRENFHQLGIEDGFKIVAVDAFQFIASYVGEPYDLIFCDPPFTQSWAEKLVAAIADNPALGPRGWLIIESGPKESVVDEVGRLKRLDTRSFGDKKLNFYQSVPQGVET